jgi:hypothetical protein
VDVVNLPPGRGVRHLALARVKSLATYVYQYVSEARATRSLRNVY